jgi:hypothetical protein
MIELPQEWPLLLCIVSYLCNLAGYLETILVHDLKRKIKCDELYPENALLLQSHICLIWVVILNLSKWFERKIFLPKNISIYISLSFNTAMGYINFPQSRIFQSKYKNYFNESQGAYICHELIAYCALPTFCITKMNTRTGQ